MAAADGINWIKGYLTVKIKGRQPERFINLVKAKNIRLWDIKRQNGEISFKISRKGFFLLREPAFKTGIRVKILNKKGLFCLVKKLRRKKLIVGCFITAFLIINILSSFVLDIEIRGNNLVDDEKIISKLEEIDLKKFSLRSNIDKEEISLRLISDFDHIAWAGVYEKGTKLIIDIKERVKAPEIVPLGIPCDIVAKRDGVLISLIIENGERAVADNQLIKKGQLLISGTLPVKNSEEKRYVHSMGKATAETQYEKTREFRLYEYEKEYTGNEKKTLSLSLFGKTLFGGIPSPYFNSDKEIKRRVIGFSEINTLIYKEYILHKKPLSKEEAEKRVKNEIKEEFEKELKDIIKEITFEITYKDNETGIARGTACATENIAEEKEIKICPSESSAPIPRNH